MTDPAPSSRAVERAVPLVVDGQAVEVHDTGITLLDALRDHLGVRSAKDGCSPQGQCGCCTVLVDGAPRVACVTPLRRVGGRTITTVDGLDPAVREMWADAFAATGASQCGFCTPGIIVRLDALRAKGADVTDHAPVERALQAHLCRCTGWQTIVEAVDGGDRPTGDPADRRHARDPRRAVDQHRAAPALALRAAAVLDRADPELVAQRAEQRTARVADLDLDAVDRQLDDGLGGGGRRDRHDGDTRAGGIPLPTGTRE